MGTAIKMLATGAQIVESVHTPDFDGKDGWICLSRPGGDAAALAELKSLLVAGNPAKYLQLRGRRVQTASTDERTAVDAAIAAEIAARPVPSKDDP